MLKHHATIKFSEECPEINKNYLTRGCLFSMCLFFVFEGNFFFDKRLQICLLWNCRCFRGTFVTKYISTCSTMVLSKYNVEAILIIILKNVKLVIKFHVRNLLINFFFILRSRFSWWLYLIDVNAKNDFKGAVVAFKGQQ